MQQRGKEITVEEFARLTREHDEFKFSLQKAAEEKQALERRNAELDHEVRRTNSASLVFQSEAKERQASLDDDPVFILSDHLAMPKNSIKGLERHGLKTISLGKKMLFASQCVVIINHELDRSL